MAKQGSKGEGFSACSCAPCWLSTLTQAPDVRRIAHIHSMQELVESLGSEMPGLGLDNVLPSKKNKSAQTTMEAET